MRPDCGQRGDRLPRLRARAGWPWTFSTIGSRRACRAPTRPPPVVLWGRHDGMGRSEAVLLAFAVEGAGVDPQDPRGLVAAGGRRQDPADVLGLELLQADRLPDLDRPG